MKNNNNRKNIMYMNILGEYVTEGEEEMEEKLEFGDKVTYLVTSPDRAEPYEIEHIYGQGLPSELIREEVKLTEAMNKFVTKAKLIGENTIKERLGFELKDIKEKRVKGRQEIEMIIDLPIGGDIIGRLVIPDFVTSIYIMNNYCDVIEQMEIGENLRTIKYCDGLIVIDIKLSKKNKYLKLADGHLYTFHGKEVIETGYDQVPMD